MSRHVLSLKVWITDKDQNVMLSEETKIGVFGKKSILLVWRGKNSDLRAMNTISTGKEDMATDPY